MTESITKALVAWRHGSPVIFTVGEHGRLRGDLTLAAQHARAESVNVLLLHARGLLSLAVAAEIYDRLGLRLERSRRLSPNPGAPRAMTTIEASAGVTTGISAADRACTIAAAVSPTAGPGDVREPGHVPVLLAASGGVRERPRPVEAVVELSRLAGLAPAGVLSEVLDRDGELAGIEDLERLGEELGAPLLAVDELVAHRPEASAA